MTAGNMTVLRLAAILTATIALICAVSDSTFAGAEALTWFFGSWLAFVLDGPWVAWSIPVRRREG